MVDIGKTENVKGWLHKNRTVNDISIIKSLSTKKKKKQIDANMNTILGGKLM